MTVKKISIVNGALSPMHLHFVVEDGALKIIVDKFGRENEECLMPGRAATFDDPEAISACTHGAHGIQFRHIFKNETGARLAIIPPQRVRSDELVYRLEEDDRR